MKPIFIKKSIVWLGAFILLAAGFYFVFDYYYPDGRSEDMIDASTVNFSNVQKAEDQYGAPQRLTIPDININAAVQYVGLTKSGAVGAPKGPADVAWFTQGPAPGQKGSAIITGHYGTWRDGSGSVFDNLSRLTVGDKIYVKNSKGKTLTFVVTGKKFYNKDNPASEVFEPKDAAYLNLITCSGTWIRSQRTFTDRLVVFTKLEG